MRNCNWLLIICIVLLAKTHAEWQSPYYQDHPLVGKVYSVQDSEWASIDELHQDLLASQYILLGETHTNADHHIGQANIAQYLIDHGESISLYLEMLPYDSWNPEAGLELDIENLLAHLNEQASGWDWESYAPILKLSLKHQLPLNGANLSKQQRAHYAQGNDNQQQECIISRDKLELDICNALSTEKLAQMKQLIFDAHCEYLPLEHTDPLANTQIAKDAAFALSLVQSKKADKNLLIAGKIHVRKDIGVPVHLQRLGAKSSSIAFMVVDPERTQIEEYIDDKFGRQFDYVIFTPNDRNQDPCVEFAEKLKKLKK